MYLCFRLVLFSGQQAAGETIVSLHLSKYENTNMKDFNTISIRGRVAYAVCCLELAIKKFESKSSIWDFLVGKLWTFTDTKDIAAWQEMLAECIPGVILGGNDYDDFELITKAEVKKLKSLYNNAHLDLCKIVEAIFDVGSIEIIDEEIDGFSVQTLNSLGTVIGICEKHKIDLPNRDIFKKYNFNEFGGWGKRFSRNDISLVN